LASPHPVGGKDILCPLASLRLSSDALASPRRMGGMLALVSPRERLCSKDSMPFLGCMGGMPALASPRDRLGSLETIPFLGSSAAQSTAVSRRPLSPLASRGRELPQLDLQACGSSAVPRSNAAFGVRRRAAPTGGGGLQLAPLDPFAQVASSAAPVPDLRPACPWDTSAPGLATSSSSSAALASVVASLPDLCARRLAPLVFPGTSKDGAHSKIADCGRDCLPHLDTTLNRATSATSASSTRAEVEKAVHDAFLEECGRGSSPTAAAAKAIWRCCSREAAQGGQESSETLPHTAFFHESHRLLLKEGPDGMGVTA